MSNFEESASKIFKLLISYLSRYPLLVSFYPSAGFLINYETKITSSFKGHNIALLAGLDKILSQRRLNEHF